MEITTIISLVRRYAWVTTSQYPDTDFLQDINMIKDEYWTLKVASLVWNINYDIWTVDDTVINQTEYNLPIINSNTAWVKSVKSISVNYTGDTYDTWELKYIPAIEVNPHTLKNDWGYYVANQSQEKPIYYISDKSLFIAPAFKSWEVWVNRIKIEWIRKIPDYTLSTTEAQMKFNVDEQRILMWGCLPLALMSKRADNNQVAKAQSDYIRERDLALRSSRDINESPREMRYPEFNNNDELWI